MSLLRKMGWIAAALALSFAFCVSAFAAEEGGAAGADTAKDIFVWVNFAIVAGGIAWVVRKYGRAGFRRTADAISEAIAKATAEKAEAVRALKESEAKLARLEQEIAAFRVTAQKEAEAEVERLVAMTKSDIEKIGIAAKTEIEATERAARQELKALAAKLAVDGAESLVAKQMTPAVQDALISNFVQSLQGRPN
jgi:F-type H+-transporting ATPase subunit b